MSDIKTMLERASEMGKETNKLMQETASNVKEMSEIQKNLQRLTIQFGKSNKGKLSTQLLGK